MTEEEWLTWAQAVKERLRRKSQGDEHNCILWEGARTKARLNATTYGYMRVRLPGGQRKKTMRVHVLAYLVAHIHVRDILLRKDRGFDISHRCHRSLCLNADHLVAEDRSTNNVRKVCKRIGLCQGHGQSRDCLLFEE